tara:strand:- start:491 stop:832 length:342 start_codon:yes stop_codon:yes gene_type:complete
MPKNMTDAGMSYKKGGSKKKKMKMKKYGAGGARKMKGSMGDGGMEATPRMVDMYAMGGGLMGTSDVMDVMMARSGMEMKRMGNEMKYGMGREMRYKHGGGKPKMKMKMKMKKK